MSDRSKQAKSYETKADKILKKWIYFGDKQEDARELYEKAANLYKMVKDFEGAAGVYEKMVKCFQKQGDSKYEAANELINAAQMYKKFKKKKAIPCYQQAVGLFIEIGKFANAAKYEKAMAEIYEELKDEKSAAEHYLLSKDYYENEDDVSNANTAYSQYAHIQTTLLEYGEAIEGFESCGNVCVGDKLLKWGAKEYFFKASLCRLAQAVKNEALHAELEEIKDKVQEYADIDVHFNDSYEYTLLTKMLEAIENDNVGKFSGAIKDYDSVKKLVPWLTSLLLKIKKGMEEADDDIR